MKHFLLVLIHDLRAKTAYVTSWCKTVLEKRHRRSLT